jgi:sugar lactone lactonase YvrE
MLQKAHTFIQGLGRGGIYLASSAFFCFACSSAGTPAPQAAVPPPEPVAPAQVELKGEAPTFTILADLGFETPESVYFDKKHDVYLVSNINGDPSAVDNNGFISRLTPQDNGEYKIELKFIDGARKGSPLNAPKGLTIAGDVLYVADLDRVRKFDALTGAPKGEVLIKGSTFINDLATGEDGAIYASDSGLTPAFSGNGTDAIYKLAADGELKTIASGPELGNPNGLLASKGGVWVATFGSGEIYWLSDTGERSAVQKLTHGQNDGIVFTNSGKLLVSSWEGSSLLGGSPEQEFQMLISDLTAPADIGYDCTRNKLLIPLFKDNKVRIEQLEP